MKIHFIGIGGIGVSAVAQYYLSQGHEVSGSDLTDSEIIRLLASKGTRIFLGQQTEKNIDDISPDLVAFSPAVLPDNPELRRAQQKSIVCKSSPQLLGEITKKFYTIAVCGSHGKSTTASMLALMLEKCGLDPSAILGTCLEEFQNSNFRAGQSQYLIIEADEYKRSFLNYYPQIIVLTNIEIDHLDYFRDLDDIRGAYKDFVAHLLDDGILVAHQSVDLSGFNAKNIIRYCAEEKISLTVPGAYNQDNANACLKVAEILQVPKNKALAALAGYKGAWRRLQETQIEIEGKSIIHISDYGHHPTQLLATVKGVREKYPNKRLTCVYQPHQYKRTLFFHEEFKRAIGQCLRLSDEFVLTDVYDVAGREDLQAKSLINSKILAEESGAKYVAQDAIREYLYKNLEAGQVLLIMSAGNFYKLS